MDSTEVKASPSSSIAPAEKAQTTPVAEKIAVKTPAKQPAKAAPKVSSKAASKTPVKAAVKAAPKVKAEKPLKEKKAKLVRDSFTIPKAEYVVLDELKLRAGKLSRQVKKSELIRAGVKALAAMSDSVFMAALKVVPAIKTGRPSKE
jgi:hypothetical protein